MLQLSIIIVNYNVKYFLEHCLYSVSKAIQTIKAEIIVVDNASSDGSLEYLLGKFPGVDFIDNPENVGFARANNQALQQAKGKYILFLNPDTIIPEDCLEQCICLLESNPKLGACGVKMIDGSGRFLPESKRAFPSLQTSFYKLSGLAYLFPRSKRFARYHLGHLPESQNSEIDILSGAFFMVRREVIRKTGGFDERFFMYGEDIDLSYRILQSGYKNYYLAETCIIHFKGESTRKGSQDYVRLFYQAMSLFVEKHFKNKNSKGFLYLIERSIWFRAGLTTTKNLFLYSRLQSVKAPLNTLLISSEEEKDRVVSILNNQAPNRKVSHVTPGENWKQAMLLQAPTEVIFVEGRLSYKEIISYMQELPEKVMVGLYSTRVQRIVGSGSKNTNGQSAV